MDMNHNTQNAMDAASIAVALGAFGEILPPLAALLAIVWTLIRIYEWIEVRFFGGKGFSNERKL